MNWFTSQWLAKKDEAYKKARLAEDGGCEHVEKDISLAHMLLRENDSFGVVGSSVICEACDTKRREDEDNEPCFCHDCSGTFPRKDVLAWRWYDFYAAQGDKPINVCRGCRQKEKHKNRVADDNADRDAEFPPDNPDSEF